MAKTLKLRKLEELGATGPLLVIASDGPLGGDGPIDIGVDGP